MKKDTKTDVPRSLDWLVGFWDGNLGTAILVLALPLFWIVQLCIDLWERIVEGDDYLPPARR